MAHAQRSRIFVGREQDRARLRALLDEVIETGNGRTAVIGGESGIGKTRLLDRFAADAAPDARVLAGACLEVAGDVLPYAPFVEILRTVVRETPAGELPAVLGAGRNDLIRLLPELAARSEELRLAPGPDRASQARLFELLFGVIERLAAAQPVLLIVDDVHWADRSTRELIAFLSRALRDDRVLLLLAVRTDPDGAAVANLEFVAELERDEHVARFELRPFDRAEIEEQAAAVLDDAPDAALVDDLLARTDGNPFYAEELLLAARAGQAAMPPVLRDVLAARIRALSAPARDLLRVAAVAGRRVDDGLLAAALGVDPRALATTLREALESGVLARQEGPGGPVSQFRHAILQELVDGELFPGERAALHLRFAEALEARQASGDRSVPPGEIGRHWDGAQRPDRALPLLVRAAESAESVYAFEEAGIRWERAASLLEELDPSGDTLGHDLPDLLARAADCAALVGEPRRAADLTQRALVHLYPGGDTDRVLALENRLRWHLWWSGDRAAAADAIEQALADIADGSPVARARVLAQRAAVRMNAGDLDGSAASASEAIELGEQAGAAVEIALAYGIFGWDIAMLGEVDAGIAVFDRGRRIAEAVGSVEGMAVAATNLAALLDRVGRSEEALAAAQAGFALTQRFGVARTYGTVLLGYAAKAELALGRWDDAERSTSTGLRFGAADAGLIWLGVIRARLLTGRGRFTEAEALLRRARAIDARLGGSDYRTALFAAEAELGAATGTLSGVLDAAEAGLAHLVATGAPDPSLARLAAITLGALADARIGRAGSRPGQEEPPDGTSARAARLQTTIEAAIGAAAGRPGFATGDRAAAVLAQLRAEQRRLAGAADPDAWREVVRRWDTIGRPFSAAMARVRLAEAIVAGHGPRDEAAKAIDDALDVAERLEARPLADQALVFARRARLATRRSEAAGGAPGRAPAAGGLPGAVEGPGGVALTAREAEVLRLLSAGWTNQQIAESLFITRKTASVHVSNVMAKLGAANRGEAAALAHRLGLVEEAELPVGGG